MSPANITCVTWKDVLKDKGFDEFLVESFIGFISWDEGEIFSKLGKEINDVLYGYEGKTLAYDVICPKYESIGILFFKNSISEENASKIFDAILEYEHNDVYDMDE